ncbi:MAG: apolipoprotein N-acyltransferase [Sphingorhabdus sp.]
MNKTPALIAKYPRWLALVAGGISATGFAPLNLWILTLLCLGLLMHFVASAESGKRAFLLGWLFGVGHFSVGNNWIAMAFTYQAAMPEWLGWVAVLLLALYLAVYPALACWGAWWVAKWVNRKTGALPVSLPFIFSFAGMWIVAEWLRSWVFTGFSWNPLGIIAIGDFASPAIHIGSYGLSGAIVALSGALLLLAHGRWRGALLISVALASLWGVSFVQFASDSVVAAINNKGIGRQRIALTVVQPNISQLDKHTAGYEAVNFVRLAQNSRPQNDQPRLVFWPESAIPWWLEDGYPRQAYVNQPGGTAAGTRQTLAKLLRPNDLLLTGGDRLEFGPDGTVAGARNSVLVMDAKGEILDTYDKAHLVPYGEYLALRWLLEPLGATRLVPGAMDFWPGPGPRTLDLPFDGKRIKVGMQICYEIIFSGQVVDRANRPNFIFQPSNDAWYGSWSRPQFLAQARLRAIEEGLPVVRATPTGISAIIDADGRIVESLPSGEAGRIDTFLPPAKAPTLFARYGNMLPLGLAALLIALAFLPLVRRRISR